ncbi:hypothetical protein FB645_002749 [Coemansia sp. IMI 203386]|nr:hypothetical protein FB645_002749 [Coemansia sp. IMI 203386]
MSLTAGILTVSDKCSKDPLQDTSGPALRQLLESNNFTVTQTLIVADEKPQIAKTVTEWVDKCQLIVVSGGTGLSSGDVTVEALDPLFTKKLPSLAIAMVMGSLKITPMAALSQVTAGIIKHSVVVAVPGSKKGSTENLQQILGVLPHAVATANAGRTLALVLDSAQRLPAVNVQVNEIRPNMVVAASVVAQEPVPAYPASVMDGYAMVASDGPGDYRVLGASTAGSCEVSTVSSGCIVRVATGAPIPSGADAVVMVEDTQLLEADSDGEEVRVRVLVPVSPGLHIRPVGYDVRQGVELLAAGAVISGVGGEAGTLAVSGNHKVLVYGTPRIAVMSSGDELVDTSEKSLAKGQVRDSNRPALLCALRALGCDAVDLGIVSDDPDKLADTMANALKTCHGIVTSGGVSMGERDWLRPVIEQRLQGKIVFGRVMMKPAKPTTFATIPNNRFVFALPGNPASAVVAFHMFVAPAIRKMAGYQVDKLQPIISAVLCGPELVLDTVRPEYARARICWNMGLQTWQATVLDSRQQSSRMASMADANALICLPIGSDHQRVVRDGDRVSVLVIAPPAFA